MHAKTVGVLSAAIIFTSCATNRDAVEEVKVFSSPIGADVTLSSGEKGVTPALFNKQRGESFQLTIDKRGYVAQTLTIQTSSGGRAGQALYPNPVVVQLSALPTDPRRRGRKPPKGGYPLGLSTDQPGMVRSPYTHRVYDIHAAAHGALIHDVDVDDLFRNP